MNAPLPSPRILFILPPAPSATLTKGGPGSGWFGPDHGGTHGPGASGASPPTLPSSAGITTLEQAQAYWRTHFAKKVMALNVHGAGRNQPIPIHVRFSDTHHAYTTDAGGRQKTGQRVFDLQRAHAMDRILRTIEHPKRRLRNFHADLLLEGKAHGHQYTVVLTWREAAQVYEFHSAHFKPIQEVERLARENDPRKNSGPLQKSEPGSGEPLPSPHSPALQTPYGVGLRPRVSPQTCRPGDVSSAGSGRTMIILPALSDLFKAYPPLEQAHTLLLWRADEPPVAALLKRMATPTGARWITVHPNGADTKGVPILIQESHAGSGVFHVIGGAGGKLNYLKLRGIKPQSEYKQQAAEKRKIQQALDKQRRERDRAAGLDASKTAEKNKIAAAHHQEEKQFVADVAKIAGWTDADLAFPHDRYAHLSPRAYQEMRARHHRERVKQAQDYIQRQAAQLLADPDHLKQALGEIPLTASDPATLSVQDLDPVKPPDRGLGFAPTYGQRAEGGKEAVRAEAAQLQQERLEAHPERKAALARRQETAAQLKQELEHQRLPAASAPPVDALPADQVMALLKRQKQLDRATKAAREARQQVDAANTLQEVKAYNLEVGGQHVEDEDVIQDVQDQLRTIQTRALLAEVAKVSEGRPPDQALERHLGAGAQAALDALSLTVAGHGLVDRSVVDVLGLEGAARTLAHRLRATLDASEMENLQQALSDYHVDHYTQRGEQAMKEAKAYQDEAAQIELEAAQTGGDLQQAQGLNRRRARALANARRVLGTCLGEFEMNAALIQALKEPSARPLEVALGKIGLESAIAQAKALGLQAGDYTLDTIGGTQFLTVRPEGLERLTQPLDAERLQRQRAALDIQQGRRDEEHWWPTGVARRPDLAAPVPPGVAPTLAEPFQPQGPDDLNRALEDYIGGRTADGDAPAAILSDVLSSPMLEQAEAAGIPRSRYMAAVNALAPSRDAKGKLMRAEAHAPAFQALADRFVQHRHGGERSPLHRQDIPLDDTATEALHRALSAEPSGIAAFKAIGDLEDADQRALRGFFDRHIARDDPDAAALRQTLAAHEKQEPERETVDMFGETGTNPAWQDWQNRRNELAEQLNAMTLDWPKYVRMMHGRKNAYAAMQDLIRSRVTEQFHHAYNTLHPQQPLKLGRQVIRGNLNHLDAIDPDARAARLTQERQLIDALRNRVGGKYAEGSVIEKLESAREQREAMAQNQMGFFGAEEEPADAPPPPLKADERHTLGHVAEQRLAALMGAVGPNFKPGEPIKLWNPSLSDKDSIGRQRAIKLIEANRRVALSLGTGSGKSLIGLAAFTDLHAQGQVKRGIFAVPSIVQQQMGAEALRYLEPGQYRWHAEPGAGREERIAALRDPQNHFVVTTHQALRDDLLHLGAQHEGITPEQLADRLAGQTPADRAAWMKDLLDREGIDAQYLMVDEGHGLLNRQGKDNSRMANVLDALSTHMTHYVNASADPSKNDASEIFSLLEKLDPAHYTDRAAFMRRFGVDTAAAKTALQRELAPYLITGRIESGQAVHRRTETVPLSAAQRRDLESVQRRVAQMRLARMKGAVDVEAARALSPGAFAGVSADQHTAVARQLARSLGVLRESALRRVFDAHPESGKLDAIHRLTAPGGELHGQPGVVFAHSLDAVRHIAERLERAGHRVVTLTGADSSQAKAQKKARFAPETGPAQADILVTSDAGAVGMNAQRGRWLIQHDVPQTALIHNQRNGRVDRIGQQHEVKLIDLVHDHPAEQAARDRLAKKYELREIMTAPQIGLDETGLAGYLLRRRAEQNGGASS